MSQYQLLKEIPAGSGILSPQGAPVTANDPTGDAVLDAEDGSIMAVLEAAEVANGGCWSATKVGA